MYLIPPVELKKLICTSKLYLDSIPSKCAMCKVVIEPTIAGYPRLEIYSACAPHLLVKTVLLTLDSISKSYVHHTGVLSDGNAPSLSLESRCLQADEVVSSIHYNLVTAQTLGFVPSAAVLLTAVHHTCVADVVTVVIHQTITPDGYQPLVSLCANDELLFEGDPGEVIVLGKEDKL